MLSDSMDSSGLEYLVRDAQVNAQGVHVWSFDRDCPVDVVHHSLSGRQPFRMNRHSYFELVYLKSGELEWQVQDKSLTEKEGDLFVMTSEKYHRITEKSSSRAKVESLFFDPALIRSSAALGDGAEYINPFLFQDSTFPHVIDAATKVPSEIRRLMVRIQGELPASTDRARLCVKTYVKMILVVLMNHYASYRTETAVADRRRRALDRFNPLFEFLEQNYSGAISAIDAAEAVNMSPSHFRRAFKQVTGQSFVLYLNLFRVAKAQEILLSSNKSIAEVGLDVGFCDQSYFGLMFRKLTHSTPRQFRKKGRQVAQVNTVLGSGRSLEVLGGALCL